MLFPFSNTPAGRSTPLWASALLLFGFWAVAQLATLPFVLPLAIASAASKGEIAAGSMFWIILIALVIGSGVLAACAIFWSRKMEGRGLHELGIRIDATGRAQYLRGWWTGLLFALALMILGGLLGYAMGLAPDAKEASEVVAHWDRLAHPAFWALLVLMGLAFAVQGAAEEIVCRGWILVNLTARYGLSAGILLSSVLFAALHPHYFFIDGFAFTMSKMVIGFAGLAAMIAMGLMLAMLSIRDRSIMGAAGMHAAFNFLVLTSGLMLMLVSGDSETVLGAFQRSFENSTSIKDVQPALFVQIFLSLAVAIVLFRRVGLPSLSDR